LTEQPGCAFLGEREGIVWYASGGDCRISHGQHHVIVRIVVAEHGNRRRNGDDCADGDLLDRLPAIGCEKGMSRRQPQ